MIIHWTVGLIKASLDKMSQHFPKPYECSGGYIKNLSDLSTYARKAGLKGTIGVDK